MAKYIVINPDNKKSVVWELTDAEVAEQKQKGRMILNQETGKSVTESVPDRPGTIQSGWEGLKEGATLGLSDEYSQLMGDPAEMERVRRARATAEADSPIAYNIGKTIGETGTEAVATLAAARANLPGVAKIMPAAIGAISGAGGADTDEIIGRVIPGIAGAASTMVPGAIKKIGKAKFNPVDVLSDYAGKSKVGRALLGRLGAEAADAADNIPSPVGLVEKYAQRHAFDMFEDVAIPGMDKLTAPLAKAAVGDAAKPAIVRGIASLVKQPDPKKINQTPMDIRSPEFAAEMSSKGYSDQEIKDLIGKSENPITRLYKKDPMSVSIPDGLEGPAKDKLIIGYLAQLGEQYQKTKDPAVLAQIEELKGQFTPVPAADIQQLSAELANANAKAARGDKEEARRAVGLRKQIQRLVEPPATSREY